LKITGEIMLESINPANGELLKIYPEMTEDEISEVLTKSEREFAIWKEFSSKERSGLLLKVSELMLKKKEKYAELITREMGKTIAQSRAEIEKCASVCEYYAEDAEKYLKDKPIKTDAQKSFISYQPLGTILAIMPWNFPFWQVFRFAAPNLMAGNAAILKHAGNVTGTALAIEEIFREAGFPENIFRTLILSSKKIETVIKDKRISAVTLTGSVAAGRAVAKAAGEVLKKTVLELGGSDPYVILEDADIERAAETCAASRLINAGQSCIAAKRFIVVEKVYEDFERLFTDIMSRKKMGDPFDEVDLGPQARNDLRDDLHRQVVASLEKGALLLTGGDLPAGKGAFYPPTVLAEVKEGMPAFDEEMFGPVAAVIKVKNEDEAIQTANMSPFGLGAAVFTKDISRGEKIASKGLKAGNCFVNTYVRSDPRLPFGGIKDSGYGRELSEIGIKEFLNIKTVYIQ
jgi:succinate-semialdehyde dehydrogenase/glutarate-semialdehyde dehydrogenase